MGRVIQKDFAVIMKNNIETYAKEVNEDRAIPSVYDGLKPVQRRILYWLSKNKGTSFLGSAEITGGVLGSFHPHGDASVYNALVRLSQPLIMSYPLIDFHGNNGSLTDVPAAMRYTKAKLSSYGQLLLNNIDVPNVIEWQDNYNETQKEPKYLLGALGTLNLLINPQIGIGVGLASNFTCHNIDDVKAVLKYRMEHPACKFEELPPLYPSFHNAGVLINKSDIPNIYKTGRGTVILRAKYHYEGNILCVTEMPYRVDATSVKKYLDAHPISGVSEVYESNGKLKIYLEKDADFEEVEKKLLKKTALQSSYAVNMTATDVDGKPRVFTLLDILDTHIALQHQRIGTCAQHNKELCVQKLHINEGLEKALDDIDRVIEIIRNSDSPAVAETNLIMELNIDNAQAKAILDIRLARLSHMEIEGVRQQIANLKSQIEYEDRVINEGELRESLYWVEMSSYTDSSKRTECLDLVSAGRDGDKIKTNGYAIFDKDFFEYHISEDQFEDGIIPWKYDCSNEWYIITNKLRGFLRKGVDLPIGRTDWKDILSLEEDEQVLYLENKSAIEKYEYLMIKCKDGKDYKIHNSFISCGCSSRGKKLVRGKYEVDLITPEGDLSKLPSIK